MKREIKKMPEKVEQLKLDVKFCTECETDLDNFFLSKKADDIEGVKANHENCKHIGKFKGEMCSKIFIAQMEEDLDSVEDDDDLD